MCNDTVYCNYIFNAYMLIAARVTLATLYSFGHIWFSTFNYLRLWYSGTCKIPQSCRHFSCPYALLLFSVSEVVSHHSLNTMVNGAAWTYLQWWSALPQHKERWQKPTRKDHNHLNCFAYQQQPILRRKYARSVETRIKQICSFVQRGIAVFMHAVCVWGGGGGNWKCDGPWGPLQNIGE